jgi:hypothetical protein
VINIPGPKRNANQKHIKISPQNSYLERNKQQQMFARMWEKGALSTVGGNVNQNNQYGKQHGRSSKN